MTTEKELAAMLTEIISKATHGGVDSCDAPMKKVRVALMDKAAALLAKHGY